HHSGPVGGTRIASLRLVGGSGHGTARRDLAPGHDSVGRRASGNGRARTPTGGRALRLAEDRGGYARGVSMGARPLKQAGVCRGELMNVVVTISSLLPESGGTSR